MQHFWGCDYSNFWDARQKDWASEILFFFSKSYVGATLNLPQNTLKKHPQHGPAANDSNLPSISSPFLPCRNDGQRYGVSNAKIVAEAK